jgi:small conductance mechanosensitive channel
MMHSIIAKLLSAVQHMIDGVIDRMPELVVALIIFFAFYVLSGFVSRGIRRAVIKRRQNLAVLFGRLTSGATVAFGFVVALSIVAPSFQAADLIKILGIGGVAIGFAFQNILQNFLAGLLLLWTEPFRVGDEIKIDPYEGRVEEIQTRATIIRTYDDRCVVVPNADLFTHSVVVNTAGQSRRWEYDLDVRRVRPLEETRSAIADAVRHAPRVLSDPAPEVFLADLTPDLVKLRVRWSTHETRHNQMLGSYDQVLTAINRALDRLQPQSQRAA